MKHRWRSRREGGYRCRDCQAIRTWSFGKHLILYPDGRVLELPVLKEPPPCDTPQVRVRGAR